MKYFSLFTSRISLSFLLLSVFSCNKKEILAITSETFSDSALVINSVVSTELNEFDISYRLDPSKSQIKLSDIYLQWSADPAFKAGNDSVLISGKLEATREDKYHVARLKAATHYFTRIKATADNQKIFSNAKTFTSDTLKLISWFAVDTFPVNFNRGTMGNPSFILTNLKSRGASLDTSAHIFLGPYNCPITDDEGNVIFFKVPTEIPYNANYTLTLRKQGMAVSTSQSFYALKNLWSQIDPPNVPIPDYAGANAIGFYGTCQSADKGYMVGGTYFRTLLQVDSAIPNRGDNGGPYSIQEFDGQSGQWSQILPQNPRIYQSPFCYYFNNSIYVIYGLMIWPGTGTFTENFMYRLDLSSKTWIQMDSLPYPSIVNPVSFELNGEWYFGMGVDLNNRDMGGTAIASKKMWKYNPGSNQWTQIADFPGNNERDPTGFSIGSKGYVFCGAIVQGRGNYISDYSQEFWEYNPSLDSWKRLSIPANGPAVGEKYCIVSHNGKGYFLNAQVNLFFGYYNGYQQQYCSVEYDPADGSFSPVANNFQSGGIVKKIFSKDNRYIFQDDAHGFTESISNMTFQLDFEP